LKGLVLAEKPSLMRAIQSAYKSEPPASFGFDLDFAAFHGHLMALAQPADYNPDWKKWKTEDLPIIPEPFKYVPSDGESIRKIIEKISAGHYDFVVNACDAGREGELIFWSFYEANGVKLPVKRLWSSTTVEADLRKALHGLRDYSEAELVNLRSSSKFRAEFDWLAGMNFSRAVALKTGKKVNIGRVVTPTLKIVVDRENEIRNFKPEKFYGITVVMDKGGEKFPGVVLVPPENKLPRFSKQEDAEGVMKKLGSTGSVAAVESEKKSIKAPTLYSTLELQKDASKYYKWRSTKTDSIAQELYEAGYISYPRTECRVIPTSLVPEIPKLLKPLEAFPELKAGLALATPAAIANTTKGKTYVDNSKLTDHHAIIPTTAVFDPSKLSDDQRKLYLLVAKRFLSIFLPPYTTAATTVFVNSNGVTIKANGRVVIDKGFSMLYQDKSKDVVLPPLVKGDTVNVGKPAIKTGETKPPDRYTDETLLDAMAHAGKFVSAAEQRAILKETAGLGTGATRSSILKKLEDTGLVTIEKSRFIPTDFGMSLIDIIKDRDISSPALTAKWEERLRTLEEKGNNAEFKKAMLDYIREETADILQNVKADLSAYDSETIGTCPICGKPVIVGKKYYRCVNYKKDPTPCTFIVSRESFMGTSISIADMKAMLAGKTTKEKTLTTKDKRVFKIPLTIKDGRVAPAFSDADPKTGPYSKDNMKTIDGLCDCPLCREGKVFLAKNYYLCTNRDNGCQLTVGKEICSAPISAEDVKTLVHGGETAPKKFVWSSGKSGTAKLKGTIQNGESGKLLKLNFIFDN